MAALREGLVTDFCLESTLEALSCILAVRSKKHAAPETISSIGGAGKPSRRRPNRVTASLAGLAMALFLVVAGLFLVQHLRDKARIEDCLLSGRQIAIELVPPSTPSSARGRRPPPRVGRWYRTRGTALSAGVDQQHDLGAAEDDRFGARRRPAGPMMLAIGVAGGRVRHCLARVRHRSRDARCARSAAAGTMTSRPYRSCSRPR